MASDLSDGRTWQEYRSVRFGVTRVRALRYDNSDVAKRFGTSWLQVVTRNYQNDGVRCFFGKLVNIYCSTNNDSRIFIFTIAEYVVRDAKSNTILRDESSTPLVSARRQKHIVVAAGRSIDGDLMATNSAADQVDWLARIHVITVDKKYYIVNDTEPIIGRLGIE